MLNILVSYFSASRSAKFVAEKVATAVNGDLFEIEPKEKYTKADLDWMNKQSRSSIEMNNNVKREIVNNEKGNKIEDKAIDHADRLIEKLREL